MAMTQESPCLQEKIKHDSYKERETHWQGVPFNEAMSKWETELNNMLKSYTTDPAKKAGLIFLQKILKESDQQPLASVEVSAKAIYNTFFQGEVKGDVEFFVARIIDNNTIEEIVHNWQHIENLAKIYGKNSAKTIMGLLTDYKKTIELQTPYSIIGTDIEEDIEIGISLKARLLTTYLIGASGTGKSTLVANLVISDIKSGLGVAVLDPHGDLIKTIIASLPENRVKDVIYLNVEDVDHPYGLNLYECQRLTIRDMAKTASFVSHAFEKIWGAGTDTPRLMQNLRAVTRTLIENPGTTFAEIPLLYSNDTVREKMVANLSNPSIISYWEDYERMNKRDRYINLESTLNKVNAFLDEPMIRNIFAQSKTTIDFRNIMDTAKILLVSLSPQYEEASRLIGAVIIGQLLMAAFSRSEAPEENCGQFNLYCDEFQRFATSDFATLISEARKFGIATTLSHQTLSQLDEANRTAAAAAGNLIVMRVSGEDAAALAKSFDTTPSQEVIGEEPIRAPVSNVISHLVTRGHNDPRVARFAQIYLKNLENFVHRPPHVGLYGPPSNMPSEYKWQGVVVFEHSDIFQARELLNETLYRCMVEKTTHFLIPPFALYMLSVAQQDGCDQIFAPYIKAGWWEDNYFRGFKKAGGATAEIFGDPYFINKDFATQFINSRQQKSLFGSITDQSRREMESARRLVNMITELRYSMAILAENPILVDTGQYQPKYQNRTYADMENQIARDLTNQQNFQAKVKLLAGEHIIQTKNYPSGLTGKYLEARIEQITEQTRQNYCKPRLEVEREIRERQERLKAVENKPNPTSAKATQPQRTRRRTAEETPPAWS
jgi:type IV secretion system coupling TraD/TrwB family protein